MAQPPDRPPQTPRPREQLIKHAQDLIDQYYTSIKRSGDPGHKSRWTDVLHSIKETGTYEQTYAELVFGVKTAWRNAPKCIGRIQWSKIQVFDARNIRTARGMYDALITHIKFGTNKGLIRSTITVFPPRSDGQHDFRVWNSQLIRYAAYRNEDGSITGDPANLEFTEFAQDKFGWKGKRTHFDVLPLILQAEGQDPELFEIPPELVLEVELIHPQYPWFEELGLKWYALPAVSMLVLDCGGLEYTASPFNGWYMGTEIGARDLCDANRYNIIKLVATKMGLELDSTTSLWKDRALVEVNISVLHSFQVKGVTIADHHSASESFMKHLKDEVNLRGGTNGDWPWVVPPMSGSLMEIFHQELIDYKLYPCFEYQDMCPWKTHVWKQTPAVIDISEVSPNQKKPKFREVARAVKLSAALMKNALTKRISCTILYATETGKSENYARQLADLFSDAFNPKVICMIDYDVNELEHEALVLIVGSTFGNGDPPDNGCDFARNLDEMQLSVFSKQGSKFDRNEAECQTTTRGRRMSLIPNNSLATPPSADNLDHCILPLANVRFAVFGLGSKAYPNFCAFGKFMDRVFEGLGAERLHALGEGDALCGQESSFKEWSHKVFEASCETFCMDTNAATKSESLKEQRWASGRYRLIPVEDAPGVCETLGRVHRKDVMSCSLIDRKQLQAEESATQTLLCRISLPSDSTVEYSPGDHLAVFPLNRPEMVDTILKHVEIESGLTAGDWFRPEMAVDTPSAFGGIIKKWTQDQRLSITTLRSALTNLLDITTPPSQSFLRHMAGWASVEAHRKKLSNLAEVPTEYEDWKHEFYPNLVEVFAEFPSLKLPASFLLTQLPLLQQRFYSISSCPSTHPGEIHVTVGVVQYTTQSGKGAKHYGVCSSWLNEISPGQLVPCFIRRAPFFHLPDDLSVPIIMIGPGTGIAPFRSFWQDRHARLADGKARFGPMVLYVGCRTSTIDFIYRAEIEEMLREGALSEVHVALSREPGQSKEHVQDVLLKHSKDVHNHLVGAGGHVYVCGDVSMASDVCETIEDILVLESPMKKRDAKECVMMLRDQNRFHEDIFGDTLWKSDDQAEQEWKPNQKANSRHSQNQNGVEINGWK